MAFLPDQDSQFQLNGDISASVVVDLDAFVHLHHDDLDGIKDQREPRELPTEAQIAVTEAQEEIMKYPYNMDEVLSISAGPGSGKTFTLIARIAQLMQDGIQPDEILVLSMANRSVDALRHSLRRLVGVEKELLVAFSTFHSFCGSLLDSNRGPELPRPRVANSKSLLMFAEFFLKKSVKLGGHSIGGIIGAKGLADLLPQLLSGRASVDEIAKRKRINPEYLRQLLHYFKSYEMIVYDDIVGDAVELLNSSSAAFQNATDSEVAQSCLIPDVAKYKVVIVDEFQDIYPLLVEAVEAIVNYPTFGRKGQSKHLTISGDPLQCIYEFLGSSPTYIEDLKKVFPHMTVVEKRLEESFRCTQPILNAAVGVIGGNNATETDNQLATTCDSQFKSLRPKDQGTKPILFTTNDLDSEAEFVADEIVRLICYLGGLIQPQDIAVLGSTNKQIEIFLQILKDRTGIISHRVRSGSDWPNSKLGIFGLLARAASGNSHASLDLVSILLILDKSTGARQRISKLFVNSLEDGRCLDSPIFFESYLQSQFSSLEKSGKSSILGKLFWGRIAQLDMIKSIITIVGEERKKAQEMHSEKRWTYGPIQLALCFNRISKLQSVSEYLLQAPFKSSLTTDEMLHSLNNSLHHLFERYTALDDPRTATFLDFFAENYEEDEPAVGGNTVEVSTIHSAKGLEFPVVFVLGMHPHRGSVMPSWNTCLNSKAFSATGTPTRYGNKASRLLYVAMTRARSLLYVGSNASLANLLRATKENFSAALPCPRVTIPVQNEACNSSQIDAGTLECTIQENNQGKFNPWGKTPFAGNLRGDSLIQFYGADMGRQPPPRSKLQQGIDIYSHYRSSNLGRFRRAYCTQVKSCWFFHRRPCMSKGLNRALCQIKYIVFTFPCR